MDNLIDHTYFKGLRVIANAQTNPDVQSLIEELVTTEQYNFLQSLFGPVLYNEYVDWYMGGEDPSNAFYELTYGLTFVYRNYTYNWVGLVNDMKIGPLLDYVYYRYQEQDATQTVSGGEVKTNSQNASNTSSVYKMTVAWNSMATYLHSFIAYMDLFYGTTGTVNYTPPLPAYKAPITIQVGVTPGVTTGATTFTFDGTSGTYDWRGYEAYPERIGQGTLVRGVNYEWDLNDGVYTSLDVNFQDEEYFNFTFSPGNPTFANLTANSNWVDYRKHGLCNEIFHHKNRWGL